MENEEKDLVVEETPHEEVVNAEKIEKDNYVMKLQEGEVPEEKPFEPNRPAFISMRIAAFIIDICLLFLGTFGFKTLFDHTSISNAYQDNYYHFCYVADHLKLDEDLVPGQRYGVQIYETDERYSDPQYKNYMVYPREEGELHYKIIDIDKIDGGTMISNELREAYNNALKNSSLYQAYGFNCRLIDYGLVMFAAGLSSTIFLLVIPFTNKRRATLGRLFGNIHLINYKYKVTAKWYQVVWRWLFIFVVEMAFPQLFLSNAIYTALVVSAVMLLSCVTNQRRRSLNDLVSRTESIEKRTYSPLNFED